MPAIKHFLLWSFLSLLAFGSSWPSRALWADEETEPEVFGPIVIKADAPTEVNARRERLAFHLQEIELYRQLTSDPAATQQAAEEFLRIAIHHTTGQPESDGAEAGRWRELPQLGKVLVDDLGSSDPWVLAYYGEALFQQGKTEAARPIVERAVVAFDQSKYPPGQKLIIQLKCEEVIYKFGNSHEIRKGVENLTAASAPWLQEIATREDWRRPAWCIFLRAASLDRFQPENGTKIVDAYTKYAEHDEWLLEMLQGWNNERTAWFHRGGGYANTVKEEGWEKFRDHLIKAAKHFQRAIELHPEYPEPSAEMIGISMAGYDQKNTRYWFNKSLEAQCDYYPAFQAMLWSLRPRWGGSHLKLLRFGEQCVKTKRFDTRIPYVYVDAVFDIQTEVGWDAALATEPKIFDKLAYVLRKLADDPSRKGQEGKLGLDQAKYLTLQAGFAIKADRFDVAGPIMIQLGEEARAEWLSWFDMRQKYDLSRIYAYVEFTEELFELRKTTKHPRKYPEVNRQSLLQYQNLIKKSKDPRGKLYLETWAERLQGEVDFADRKRVELNFDPDLRQWVGETRVFKVEDEHTIAASNIDQPYPVWLYCNSEFFGPKEISLEVELVKTISPVIHFGVYVGHVHQLAEAVPDGRMFFASSHRNGVGIGGLNIEPIKVDLPFKPQRLMVKYWGPHYFEYYVNGQLSGMSTRDDEFIASAEQLGIGFPAWYQMTGEVRFRNVRIRSLGDEPPSASGDQQPRINYYTEELKFNPDLWDHYFQRGLAYYLDEQRQNSIADFKVALENMPEVNTARMYLGDLYCQTGKYAEGLKLLEEAARQEPEPGAEARVMLAKNLAIVPDDKLRDGKRALEIASTAITPKTEAAKMLVLAMAQGETGGFDAALETLKKLKDTSAGQVYSERIAELEQDFKKQKPCRLKPAEVMD